MLPWMMALSYAESVDGGDPSATPVPLQFTVTDSSTPGSVPGVDDIPVARITWRTQNVNDALYEWVVLCAPQPVGFQPWTGTVTPSVTPVEIANVACSAGAYDQTLTRLTTPTTYHAFYTLQLRRLADGTYVDNPENTLYASPVFGFFDYTRQIPEYGLNL